jgi:hypothetical protein
MNKEILQLQGELPMKCYKNINVDKTVKEIVCSIGNGFIKYNIRLDNITLFSIVLWKVILLKLYF